MNIGNDVAVLTPLLTPVSATPVHSGERPKACGEDRSRSCRCEASYFCTGSDPHILCSMGRRPPLYILG